MRPALRTAIAVAFMFVEVPGASAHHEAIFGPQSSLLISQRGFASLQAFSKRQGPAGARSQDTTLLLSLGYEPFETVPLSFVITVPAAYELEAGGGGHAGLEDVLFGGRYRLDLTGLQSAFGSEGNFVILMGAVELPTGTLHRDPFDRSPSALAAIFGSVERRRFSAMAFLFGSRHGADGDGSRDGHELFVGGGLAYTPIDEENRLLSVQLGLSYEHLFSAREGGSVVEATRGGQLMLSPTTVLGLTEHWQLFALASFPAVQSRQDEAMRDLWRIGVGVIYAFSHRHD